MKNGIITMVVTVALLFGQNAIGQKSPNQIKIKATVVDSLSKQGIAFATLSLLKMPEKNIVQKLITGENGKFQINANAGKYRLQVYSMGYQIKEIDFDALETITEIDLGEINMLISSISLKEVNIVAEKPLVTIDADKISYNPESDPDSKTSNALEMMRKVPLLSVDGEDNVQLKGSSNFKYLLNGKPSTMLSSNAKDFLKSLPASAVKNIEVITSPGAKYDAEGVSGIINIVTQTKSIKGYTCSINTGINSLGGINSGFYLAASIKKLTFTTNFYYNSYTQPWYENKTYRENKINDEGHYFISNGKYKNNGVSPYSSSELSYEIDTLNLISSSFFFWKGINQSLSNSDINITSVNNELSQAYRTLYDYDYSFGSAEGNIDYQKTFKRNKEQMLTLSYKLSSTNNSSDVHSDIENIYMFFPSKRINTNKEKEYEHTYQADYVQPFDKYGKMEFGAKYIQRINASETNGKIYLFPEQKYVENSSDFTDFSHHTDISAGYLTYSKKIGNFGINSGLRYEHAITKAIISQENKFDFKNESMEYVPSVSISYKLTKTQNLRFAYNKRIQRPSIWYLNPRVNNNDPKIIYYGNPNLRPEQFHNFELSYGFFSKMGNINFSTSYAFCDNGIDRLIWVENNEIIYSTYRNMAKTKSYTQNLYTNLSLSKKLRLGLNVTAIYTELESSLDEASQNDGWGYRSNGWMQYSLMKGFRLTAYGGYYKNAPSLQSRSFGYDYSGINLSKYFLNDKLTVTVGVNEAFYKEKKWENERWTEYVYQKSIGYRPGRNYRFSISYRFGEMNAQVKKASKSINNDDVKKGGESNGSSGN